MHPRHCDMCPVNTHNVNDAGGTNGDWTGLEDRTGMLN